VATDSLIQGYAEALFRVVQAEGDLDRVEDELFRFGKLLETNNELKQVLSDRGVDRAKRVAVLEELLEGKASDHTMGLLAFVVEQGRGRQLPEILEGLSELVAEAKNSALAEVRTAVPLDAKQQKALAKALEKATGKKIELKVLIDPSVIGGVVAKVGDTVIDGTVKHRLEQLKESVGSGR
jgi:F-type H+-transporting ATPase subunit delta